MCQRTTDSVDDVSCAFAREMTRLCYEHYETRLSKKGKPQKNCEWTLLAAVIQSLHSEEGSIITHLLFYMLYFSLHRTLTLSLLTIFSVTRPVLEFFGSFRVIS